MKSPLRHLIQAVLAALFAGNGAERAGAQVGPGDTDLVAQAALAALGVAALPGDGATTISVLGASGAQADFFSTQIGGGYNPSDESSLYLEGYLAYQNYSPIFILPVPDPTLIDVRWSSVAFTGGVGWDMNLTEELVFRPVALASVGHVFGQAIFDGLLPSASGADPGGLFEDGLFAGGLGAALSLDYDAEVSGTRLDVRARHSWMKSVPVGEPDRLGVSSIASATNLFGRATRPIPGANWGGLPLNAVAEASYTRFWGDQAIILRTDWLSTIGAGLEVELPESTPASLSAGRLTLRYVFGQNYDGISIGIGLSF